MVSTRSEKTPPAGVPTCTHAQTEREERRQRRQRQESGEGRDYHCGKKLKSIYHETTLFSRAVCPV